jgi:hypothetical protein
VPPRFDVEEEALSEDSGPFEPIRARPEPIVPDDADDLPPISPTAPAWLREALEHDRVIDPSATGGDPDETPTVIGGVPTVLVAKEARIRHVETEVFDFTDTRDDDDDVLARLEKPAPRPTLSRTPPPSSVRAPSSAFVGLTNPTSAPPLPTAPGVARDAGEPKPGAPAAAPAAAMAPVSLGPVPTPMVGATSKPARIASLEYMSGPDRGKRVSVGERLTVGQGPACGMAIPSDTRLSPLHCTVERTPAGYLLVDSGSANGTVVNGQRISEIDLSGGEVIMVGRTVLRFQLEDRE